MTGRIVKGIAGFYYVHVVESGIYECKAKGGFRKQKIKPLVGDQVEIDVIDETEKTGNIVDILPRQNELIRPAVANVDQALVIFASDKPKPNFNLLDRFLLLMHCSKVPVIICFNKADLIDEKTKEELRSIYAPCEIKVLFTSAKTGEGVEEFLSVLQDKTTTVAGPSGVGKSSLVNLLQTKVEMETGEISTKIERGRHTTRDRKSVG